eukprot:ANDGO_04832.mRNA.1 hypothetical protein ACA1_097760
MDRRKNPYSLRTTLVSPSVFLYASLLIAIAGLILLVIRALPGKRIDVFMDGVATVVWYESSYNVLYTAKYLLGDYNCADGPNSISGHYNLYIFLCVSLFYLTVKNRRNARLIANYVNRKLLTHISLFKLTISAFIAVLICTTFLFLAVFSSYRTWVFGFHTIRQICYGSLFAVINLFIWSLVIGAEYSSQHAAQHRDRRRVLLGSSVFLGLSVVFKIAFSPVQLWDHFVFQLLLLFILLFVFKSGRLHAAHRSD